MVEIFRTKFNPGGGPDSYFRGRNQIDRVWYTRNIVPIEFSFFPYHFSTGCHRAYVVDFQMKGMLGELSVLLCALNKRRLTCSLTIIVRRYLERA